jgi:hypothetical protein
MNMHCGDLGVQRNGCFALWCMTDAAANKTAAAAAGALSALLGAHAAHADNEKLCSFFCGALRCLMKDDVRNQADAGTRDAIVAVVAALNAHAMHVDTQEQGLGAVCEYGKLCFANRAPAVRSAAVEAVAAALHAHPAHLGVHRSALVALAALTQDNIDDAVRRATAAGTVEACIDTMRGRSFASDMAARDRVYQDACLALAVLLHNGGEEEEQRAVRAGAANGAFRIDAAVLPASGAPLLGLYADAHACIVRHLRVAVAAHSTCAHPDCVRCRLACALPGCGVRTRADGTSARPLRRCGACRAVAYCGPAHQRADWARHRLECRSEAAERAAGSGAPQQQ